MTPTPFLAENGVALLLAGIAYELMHMVRCLAEVGTGEGFSLRRVRERLLKAATSIARHSRRICYRIAASEAQLWRVVARLLPAFGAGTGRLGPGTAPRTSRKRAFYATWPLYRLYIMYCRLESMSLVAFLATRKVL
jgi:hypothetical protein